MTLLVVGVVAFIGIHCVGMLGLRPGFVARLGEGPWKGLYSLVSIASLAAIVYGYGEARGTPDYLWVLPVGARHGALALMVPVFPLLFAAYFPGRIQAAVGHPMLVATALWAASHLLANGGVHDVLLFGSFLGWSVAMLVSYRFRTARPVPAAPPSSFNDGIAVVGGLLVYGALFGGLHAWLFGVAPF